MLPAKRTACAMMSWLALAGVASQSRSETAPPTQSAAGTLSDRCRRSAVCTLDGELSDPAAPHGEGGIARIVLADGSCVNVSLPDVLSQRLDRRGPFAARLRGRTFRYPHLSGWFIYSAQGRLISDGPCGDWYVYVPGPHESLNAHYRFKVTVMTDEPPGGPKEAAPAAEPQPDTR